ncbi:hypothetical protein ACM46_05950 [Chryseobacterium angstadtii]|uniref:Uncharacterized protein n=1 Tax=Chryseobacterium angstadtii TaxID=558151 RepID=A0A0J7IG82_9FLAO|nr:hypothetical protein [Chryseobacterium angstadtii]KMQ65438.1 hypothetical protein ACM46_05950 [Chryseobacterium angstadtii]
MKKLENPYYHLNINSFCQTEVYVNDVIIDEWKGLQTQGNERNIVVAPINHAILQSGKYKVVGKMSPKYGEKLLTEESSYLGIEFLVSEAARMKETRAPFQPKIESPWNGLSSGIQFPQFEIATEIEVELPFVLDGWQNSVDLNTIPENELFDQVYNYYHQIRNVLEQHDLETFLKMSEDKKNLQEQAFYFSEERKNDFLNGARQLFSQKLPVIELKREEVKMEIMGYGKLVRLIRNDGSQPLQFKSPDSFEQSNIELEVKLHMRSREKGLTII